MPDYSQFIKLLNANLPAPSVAAATGTLSLNTDAVSPAEASSFLRAADATWRQIVASDATAKEKGSTYGSANATNSNTATPAVSAINAPPTILIGRMTISTEDRWRIQAAMRREEARAGQGRKEYNKKVTRAIIVTKGPSADAFPPGRGRPL
ncbi:hypothetical protein STCU_04314 [Strigomonas culicis]|uniref:Uncharacterized protein n=1 Tax=Strigomonas culicis TaxID=28005 RepID=S9VP25_9TRYP|nr:hypothetical protein STCU_04889 [Strigomonas culicis]EPY29943.1 hypothetical protein STCU_04314 [Strigomonas culicis]|eukprot:EPY28771.1 hypothetical protein STCU_04889 [Strigomonas culicis]